VKNCYIFAIAVLVLAAPARADEPAKPIEPPKGIPLPKGIVLVELKVPVTSAAGGFIVPGSRVNVIFDASELKTTARMDDVMVYAVDAGDSKENVTIFVGVTKAQKELVALLLREKAKPQFVLRVPEKK
jgi:hypothetical protein